MKFVLNRLLTLAAFSTCFFSLPALALSQQTTSSTLSLTALQLASAQAAALVQNPQCPETAATVLAAVPAKAQIDKTPSAVWLNSTKIQWPGLNPTAGSRFALLVSASSSIVAEKNELARGFDQRIDLTVSESALSDSLAKRFAYLEAGVKLSLPANDLAQQQTFLRKLMTQQVVLIQEDASGGMIRATEVQAARLLDELYAEAENSAALGVSVKKDKTTFRVWAPTAKQVNLCAKFFGSSKKTVSNNPELQVVKMQRDEGTGVWSAQFDKNLSGATYTYAVDVHVNQLGLVRNRVTDPYSISLNADSKASYVADLDSAALKPQGWGNANHRKQIQRLARVKNATDMMIYELHVRDFSADDQSVPRLMRGKYLAFTQKNSDGMKHLQSLAEAGITDIHFLPFFDLATVPEVDCKQGIPSAQALDDLRKNPASELPQAEAQANKSTDCFNWGYDPFHYTAPEGSFASNASNPATRVIELRRMIMSLHAMGLRVGMDVVYNHTSSAGQTNHSVLDRIVPGYYQRLSSKGEIETSTCCSNTATEHRMMARLMRDSVITWAKDYGINSFRFDLMGHQPKDEMVRIQQEVNQIVSKRGPKQIVHFIGEGWNFGEVANNRRFVQASQVNLNGTGIGTFSDRARDAIRGGGCCDSGPASVESKGFVNRQYGSTNETNASKVQALQQADMARVGLAGSIQSYVLPTVDGKSMTLEKIRYGDGAAGYVSEPSEVVNYVENHDNQTLFDIHVFKLPTETTASDRARVQVLALAFPILSQGVAYFHAGGELLRSKSLDRNSYDSGDWFNRMDWSGRTHAFPSGLPIKNDNGGDWGLMQAFLENPSIRVKQSNILWTRDQFLALLKIRAQTALLRLSTAQAITDRLTFHNTGPNSIAGLIVGDLNGRGLAKAKHQSLVYFINARQSETTIQIGALKGRKLMVHEALLGAGSQSRALDANQRKVKFVNNTGTVTIPPRTVTVLVN
jgi:pullulanase